MPGWLKPDSTTKAIAAVAAIAYILGLLTTALYLYQKDVPLPDLTALKPRFIYTGVIVVGCIIVGGLVPCIAWFVGLPNGRKAAPASPGTPPAEDPPPASTPASGRTRTRPITALGMLICLLFFEWLGYAAVVQSGQAYTTGDSAKTALGLTVLATATGLATLVLIPAAGAKDNAAILTGLAGLVVFGLVIWFLTIFSRSVFPRIPEQYGGGEPKRAELLFKSDARTQAGDMGIPFHVGSYLSRPVTLLYAGDDFYTLQLDNSRVVQLAKDSILGSSTDSKRPSARKIQTRDVGGNRGTAEPGDQLVLTYSEPVAPQTVLPAWTGRSTPVALRTAAPGDRSHDEITVWDASHRRELALGVVEFRFNESSSITTPRFTHAHVAQVGTQVIVTLDEPPGVSRPGAGTFLVWIPSEDAADAFGNHAIGRDVQEQGDDNPHLHPEF